MGGHRLVKVGVFFFYPLGFANCQPILYISNVEEHHDRYNYSNEYSFGFANGQPFLYI